MRIGILTFHRALNYGAMLQAYALLKYLRLQGYEAEIIDYRQPNLEQTWKLISKDRLLGKRLIGTIRRILNEFLWTFWFRLSRYKAFHSFAKKYFILSRPISSYNQLPPYDVYIIGSDQVWNYKLTNGLDNLFTGNFDKKSSKIVFYAASTAPYVLTPEQKKVFEKGFKNSDLISVREDILLPIFQPLTNKKIEVVADPTLLLDRQYYEDIATPIKIHKDYILIYQIASSDKVIEIAKSIAKENNWDIIIIPSNVETTFKHNIKKNISPQDFLGYIKYSRCLITTSFHGTVFAIKFQKPFYTFTFGAPTDSRSIHLCRMFGLTNRLINKDSIVKFSEIDYSKTRNIDINSSYNFLNLSRLCK